MVKLSETACFRCREQKLRCSREQPQCTRCSRASIDCSYPSPPDRKSLAARRMTPKKRPNDDVPDQESRRPPVRQSRGQPPASPANSTSPASGDGHNLTASASSICTLPGDPVPKRTIRILIQVYFACTFNSMLNFHQPTFEHAFEDGKLLQHNVLAVCALATSFLTPSSFFGRQYASELSPLGDLASLGKQWALTAGRTVLPEIDQPTLTITQTCQVLAMYWFKTGDVQRNAMFSGIALRASRMKVLEQQSAESAPPWLESETERRCFWASWIMNCINSDHYVHGTSADRFALTLPLPMNEACFRDEIQTPSQTLSNSILADAPASSSSVRHASVTGELVKAVFHWTRIRDHIETRSADSAKDTLAQLFSLDDGLSKWLANLPPNFTYTRRNLYEQLIVQQQPVYAVIHAMYHQCRLVLYSSVVPQFSGLALKGVTPPEVVTMSAQIALNSAKALSEMSANLLALEWDPAQLAAYFGYCMYAAASIHITLVVSRDSQVAAEASKNLASNLKMLKAMKPFWKNLDKLWTRICVLYEAQTARLNDLSRAGNVPEEEDANSLDRVAGVARDAGRLQEPLKDSVLQYTLSKLRQNINVDQGSPLEQRLDSATHSEQISALLHDGTPGSDAHHPTPAATEDTVHSRHESFATPAHQMLQQQQQHANHVPQSLSGDSQPLVANDPRLAQWNVFDGGISMNWQAELGALPQGWLAADDFLPYY